MIGAEILKQAMCESGTSVVFSLSGNQIMPIYDACSDSDIRIVHVRHENAAVFMADAYGQLNAHRIAPTVERCPRGLESGGLAGGGLETRGLETGNSEQRISEIRDSETRDVPTGSACGVALVTAGPGFANALGGLYSALMAESPMILISGDSAVSQDGKRAFQELSQLKASEPFVKHNVRVTDVNRLAESWRECVSIATSGTPGPVHLAVPFDVLLAEGVSHVGDIPAAVNTGRPATDKLPDISRALLAAQKPVVLTGPAMTDTRMPERLRAMKQILGMPVIAMESPRGLADPALGKLGTVLEQADCVVLLGKQPDFTLGFGNASKLPASTVIVVDADAESLQRSIEVLVESESMAQGPATDKPATDKPATDKPATDNAAGGQSIDRRHRIIAVNQNPVEVADGLCAMYTRCEEHIAWLEDSTAQLNAVPRLTDLQEQFVSAAAAHGSAPSATPPATPRTATSTASESIAEMLTPLQIGEQVQQAINGCQHSALVCDGGEFGQWAQASVQADLRLINGPSGAIGGSLPQAIAAKISNPECIVFAMLGDGTVGFHLAELETSVRENAPMIVIIGNDSRWNAEYQIQLRDYGQHRLHSCELGPSVRYDVAATGLGFAGAWVQTEDELRDALMCAVERSQMEGLGTCINISMVGWQAPVF